LLIPLESSQKIFALLSNVAVVVRQESSLG
jgi:hypothetical protein